MFIHLRAHSDYYFGFSNTKISDLVAFCLKQKMPAICLANKNNLFGSLEFAMIAAKSGIQPITGSIITIDCSEVIDCKINQKNALIDISKIEDSNKILFESSDLLQSNHQNFNSSIAHHQSNSFDSSQYSKSSKYKKEYIGDLLIIAKNEKGYENLMHLVSALYLEKVNVSQCYKNENTKNSKKNVSKKKEANNDIKSISLSLLIEKSDGLIILWGGENSPFSNDIEGDSISLAEILLEKLCKSKAEIFIEISRNKFTSDNSIQHISNYKNRLSNTLIAKENILLDLAYKYNIPIVATNPVHFLQSSTYEACDVLSCIIHSRYVLEENRPKINSNHYFKTSEEMEDLFSDLPEAIENTGLIARKCSFMPEPRSPLLPSFALDKDEKQYLQEQAYLGLTLRLKNMSNTLKTKEKDYWLRLDFELSTINSMGFPGYFLIVSDFIRWSKKNNIPVGPGRGSGAGSVVAWALEITDLDPLHFGLLFERFLNPERVSLPDFDIDFCQSRRDEVIQYVRKRYGFDNVAHIITFGKLQARAVLRDVGRVLQMPYGLVDKICKMIPNNPAHPITLKEAIQIDKEMQRMRDDEPDIAKLLAISLQLEGVHRHVSTHAAGVIIADRPIEKLVPLYRTPEMEIPMVQYSMKYAEAAGLMKFDFLGLKTLTVIAETCKLIDKNHYDIVSQNLSDFDINQIPFDDKKTFDLLSKGQAVGVFQFEGSGMREAIKNLKPDHINDLIALTSLYRPGPMDNIPLYINRKHGVEKVEHIHPLLEKVLAETYGIIVYQEQVMQIAQILAGYSLSEADLLRRAMGKKNKQEMEAQRNIFVTKAVKKGLNKAQAVNIFDLVNKFASYGFNKSHAAAYSVISYQTAYLKANYTIEFLVASVNLEIDDTDKISLFCREAKDMNIDVLPPCIQKSNVYFSIEKHMNKPAIRFGLAGIKSAGSKVLEEIIAERNKNGIYKNIYDFAERVSKFSINKRMLENLAKAGSFLSLHSNTAQLLVEMETIFHFYSDNNEITKQFNLFNLASKSAEESSRDSNTNVILHSNHLKLKDVEPFNFKNEIAAEYQALGFYLRHHPLEPYNQRLKKLGVISSNQFEQDCNEDINLVKVAGVIASCKIRSSNGGRNSKYAFIQISDMNGMINTSIFNDDIIYNQQSLLAIGTLVLCDLQIRRDSGGMRSNVEKIESLENRMSHMKSKYMIYVDNINYLHDIINTIKSRKDTEDNSDDYVNQCTAVLALKVSSKTVILTTGKPLYLTYEDVENLDKKNGITAKEI